MWPFIAEWLSPQGLIAAGVIYTGVQAWRAKRASTANSKTIVQVSDDVRRIEVATNSMKDALIVATAKASDLEGEKRGRADEIARQEAGKTT